MKRVSVATHGHCFDGMCSAAVFTRLLEHLHGPGALSFTYRAQGYGPGQNGVPLEALDGDINAILDFRFTRAPQLTWYFDHHVSAFPTAEDRGAYESMTRAEPRLAHHDGAYGSCTKLIADVAKERFGMDTGPLAELVHWADMIDRAAFPSAEMAVSRKEPVLHLMTVVEHAGDDAFLARMVPRILSEGVVAVAGSDEVRAAYEPLAAQHGAFVDLVRAHAREVGPVVLVDLSEVVVEVAAKFVTYALYPESAYSVMVTRGQSRSKISIGYNPWSPHARTHDIARICERHGGGGHPVVGAISLGAGDVERARAIAREITDELAS